MIGIQIYDLFFAQEPTTSTPTATATIKETTLNHNHNHNHLHNSRESRESKRNQDIFLNKLTS